MRLVYLLRTKDGIVVSHQAPEGLTFSKNHKIWFLRGFSYGVGKIHHEFHYGSFEMLGVFDLNKQEHFDNLFQMFESYLRHHLEQKLLWSLEKITPIRKNNPNPPSGPGGFSHTPIAQAVLEACRRGGIELW